MKSLKLLWITLLLGGVSCTNESPERTVEAPKATHPYETAGLIAEPTLFYPGEVSTSIDKFNTSFSPDGRTIYYTATSQKLGVTGIVGQEFLGGHFQEPQFMNFVSHEAPTTDVQIAPDGSQLFFSTFMDYEGKPEGFNFNIWVAENKEGIWQAPMPMDSVINSPGNEFYPVLTNSGNLYFNSDISGNSDIYYSPFQNGAFQKPVRLPDNINSPETEADAFIARDESYLIFVRVDAPDGFGNSDLYISFRNSDNNWTDPKNMGEAINSTGIDGSPHVTPDGNYLFFTSSRGEPGVKENAMKDYASFKSIMTGHQNGSLNFYYLSFDPAKFRD